MKSIWQSRKRGVLALVVSLLCSGCLSGGGGAGNSSAGGGGGGTAVSVVPHQVPVLPSAPVIDSPSLNPLVSNTSTVTIEGNCNTANTLLVSEGTDTTNIACNAGRFSYEATKNDDGTFLFSFTHRNGAGDVSPVALFTWRRDTQSPAQITLTNPSSPNYTSNQDDLQIRGLCEPEATVYLDPEFGDALSMLCRGGSFEFNVHHDVDGEYRFSVYQRDWAGNPSPELPLLWVRDDEAPATPVITVPASFPLYTKEHSVVFQVSCTPGNPGYATWELGNGTFACDANGNGTVTFEIPTTQTTARTLTALIWQTGASGAASAQSTAVVEFDPILPDAPGIGASELIRAQETASIPIVCEPFARVRIFRDEYAGTPAEVACDVAGEIQYTLLGRLGEQVLYYFDQYDRAGNYSAITQFRYTFDPSIPDPVEIIHPASPYLTNQTLFDVRVSCHIGNKVVAEGEPVVGTTEKSCESGGSVTFQVSANQNGAHSVYFKHVRGLTGTESAHREFTWTYDNQPPSFQLTSPSLIDGNVYSNESFFVDGTCEAGSTVYITGSIEMSMPCPSGSFQLFLTQSSDGAYPYQLRAVDAAGNPSEIVSLTWIRDSQHPDPPVVLWPSTAYTYTNQENVSLRGQCTVGTEIHTEGLVAHGVANQEESVLCENGTYEFLISTNIDRTYEIQTHARKPHFTLKSNSVTHAWIRDTVAPEFFLGANSVSSGTTLSRRATFEFWPSGEPIEHFECRLDGGSYSVCASPASFEGLSVGPHQIEIRAVDLAGNPSLPKSHSWTISDNIQAVAIYHFDSPNHLADASYNGETETPGTLLDFGTSSTFGKFAGGRALVKSLYQYLVAPHRESHTSIGDRLLVEGFFSLSTLPGKGKKYALVSKMGSTVGSYGWEVLLKRISSSHMAIVFRASIDGGQSIKEVISAPLEINTGQYYHIAAMFLGGHSESASVRLFLNGARVAASSIINTNGRVARIHPAAVELQIGKNYSSSDFYNGKIDEICIYNDTEKYSSNGFVPPATQCTPQ